MNQLITDLKKIEQLGKRNEDENLDFRAFLKGQDPDEIDRRVHRLYKEISAQIDCSKCANCCKKQTPGLSQKEAEQISSHLNMALEDFRDQYVETDWTGRMMLKDQPCVFLKDNACTISHIMPEDCRFYPYLHKDDFVSRLFGVIDNYSVCPIVFNVYEGLKEELDFDDEEFDDFF